MVAQTPGHATAEGGIRAGLAIRCLKPPPYRQDWEVFKVFDSREETQESEDEVEFAMTSSASMDDAGTKALLPLCCNSLECSKDSENYAG